MEPQELLDPEELKEIIEEEIPDSTVTVTDLTGTRDHYRVDVVSPVFEGKTLVQQHQVVYRAVGDHMTGAVHALQIRTRTPEEGA
ncbi:MAG: BolA/IbaG family iron-sulfur metabolism protein [Acidobacteriota bacterium]